MATLRVVSRMSTSITEIENRFAGLNPEQLLDCYRLMFLSRRLDDREIVLKRQQRVFFQISGAGHEALLIAAGLTLKPASDWFYPYYRDRALCLALGMTAEEMLLEAVGAGDDPNSGGRQMPSHWASKRLNIVTQSSPTGSQFLQAIGCADAGRYFNLHPHASKKAFGDYRQFKDVSFHPDEVVYVSGGDGTTSEGEFWESMNAASNRKLPVLFLIEDNEYAISVPVEVNTAGGNISRLVQNFPNFHFAEVDGCDLIASYAALKDAVEYVRSGSGPAFVHGHVIRPYSHSLSDDERLYRPATEIETHKERDPLFRLRHLLVAEAISDERSLSEIEKQIETEVQEAADRALSAKFPEPGSVTKFVYSPNIDPASRDFSTIPAFASANVADVKPEDYSQAAQSGQARPGETAGKIKAAGERTMADLINACLRDEMRRDERIVLFGEDVADCSRSEYLDQKLIKGKGGVFKLTAGLQCEFGSERVFNAPLAEASIVGRSIGMGTRGLKPVAEIQFFDYIWPAMEQLRNEMPLIRWRSNNAFSCPAVIRVAIGGYLTGGGIYHSQCGESIFTHTPGIRVVFPSNALDANGLLRTAIRCDDPVLFLEHKRLYRETFGRAPYPGPDYMVPFGKARVVQSGSDLTLVTYGALVPRSLQAAQRAERDHGIKVELLDLRTLNPYDWEAIANSVSKTHRVLVAHEDMLSWGYGAEIAARIAAELFDHLDAPPRRVAAKDLFVAYQPALEDVILPQTNDVYDAIVSLAEY
jgi:2-oxoisovalerate dehydrogenase E1 component